MVLFRWINRNGHTIATDVEMTQKNGMTINYENNGNTIKNNGHTINGMTMRRTL